MAAICPENISPEVKEMSQWGCYKLETVDGKKTKVPYSPTTSEKAKSTDPRMWSSFDVALAAYQDLETYDGICFFLTEESHIVFIDLDNCIKDGRIEPWALGIVTRFKSYTELSQSGRGLHILIKGIKPGNRCRTAKYPHNVEIYSKARQCCLTGNLLVDGCNTIKVRQDELNELYREIFGEELPPAEEIAKPIYSELADDSLIERAMLAKNGKEFKSLWDGSLLGHNGDESAADMALMNHLAFWTGGNAIQMERLFSRSALGKRQKWNGRDDYRERTINKAISDAREFYMPHDDESGTISEEVLNAYSLSEGPKFSCELPKDHFIQRYMAYGEDVSDAYPDYWFAGGLFTLAVMADKKLKVVLKQGTIYPNLYISINGKSSLARKSTAVDKTEAMLCQVLPQLLPSLVPTEFSPEAFTEHLSDHNHAPWIRDEAAGVLSLMKKDYMRGFKDSLMQLYDSKPFCRKLRTSQRKSIKTEFRVDDPYLNVFFATTDASLGANTEQNDTLSGFMARFLFFFPQGKKPHWMPLEEGTDQNSTFEDPVRDQLISIAEKMKDLGECNALHFSPDAARYFREWQRLREEEWTASNDGFCMQIYSRLAPTIAKLGILFELGSSDFDVNRPIRIEFIQEACRLVDSYFMPTAMAVYDLVGANAEKNIIDRISAYLKNHGGKATRKDILSGVKIKSSDFDEYLSTMVESGIVEVKEVSRNGKGRDSKWVLLRPNQPIVAKVSNVAKEAIIVKVDENFSEEFEGNKPTLATLATMDTLATLATVEGSDKFLPANPGLQRFKEGIKKRHCLMCEKNFPYDLGNPYQDGYICPACRSDKEPRNIMHDAIAKLLAIMETDHIPITVEAIVETLSIDNPILPMGRLLEEGYKESEDVDTHGNTIYVKK